MIYEKEEFLLRLDPDLKKVYRNMAKLNRRSLSAQMNHALELQARSDLRTLSQSLLDAQGKSLFVPSEIGGLSLQDIQERLSGLGLFSKEI
jgi:hypothetical protein